MKAPQLREGDVVRRAGSVLRNIRGEVVARAAGGGQVGTVVDDLEIRLDHGKVVTDVAVRFDTGQAVLPADELELLSRPLRVGDRVVSRSGSSFFDCDEQYSDAASVAQWIAHGWTHVDGTAIAPAATVTITRVEEVPIKVEAQIRIRRPAPAGSRTSLRELIAENIPTSKERVILNARVAKAMEIAWQRDELGARTRYEALVARVLEKLGRSQ